MHTDADFLEKLFANPTDDVTRLIYADWLEEQSDPVSDAQAEFLRLTAELAPKTGRRGWRKARRKRLQKVSFTSL